MTATLVTQTLHANHPSLKAATCIQPSVVSLRRRLLHAFRPASTQLQRVSCSCLPLRASQATPALTGVSTVTDDATKANSSNASDVQTAFTEAGLSQDAIGHILTQYPPYLRWDVEQKLLPGLQCWQQELGDRFVSEFERIPRLLLRKPEEEQLKDQYLASIGIRSPEILRKRTPAGFRQSLTSMQSKVAFLQQCGLTEAQTLSLIEVHSDIFARSSEHVDELFRVISDMFGCARGTSTLSDVLLSCKCRGLFSVSPAALHRNFTYFCNCIGANVTEKQRAWKRGVFRASPAELDIRLDSIAAQLNSTLDEAKVVLRRMPQITILLPETVGLHVTQLLGLGFSHGQVKSMCLRQPFLLTYSYSSDVHVAKWGFLIHVLHLCHDDIAACPHLLMASLPNRMGPRWEYLLQLRLHGLIAFAGAHEVLRWLVSSTDVQFRAAQSTPQMRVYDEHFQKQWQQRWDFLLVDQQLSIKNIGDNPALFNISLKDT